jgi:hypothetical protein
MKDLEKWEKTAVWDKSQFICTLCRGLLDKALANGVVEGRETGK